MKDDPILAFLILVIAFVVLGAPLFAWYSASTKAAVWRRNGCDISTWEVMMGATPAVKVVP